MAKSMAKRTKIAIAVVLVAVMAMGLCACAPLSESETDGLKQEDELATPVPEDGLTALELELPDGSIVDMMEQSSITLPSDNIGKEVKLRGTKIVNGEEISKELKTYELKEGYNDITVHVALADDATEERKITVFVELADAPLKSSEPSDAAESPSAQASE